MADPTMTCKACGWAIPITAEWVGVLHLRCPACGHRLRSLPDGISRAIPPVDLDQDRLDSILRLAAKLSPQTAATALVEARIQILVDETLANSCLEGVQLDPQAVRRSVLLAMAREQGLLGPPEPGT